MKVRHFILFHFLVCCMAVSAQTSNQRIEIKGGNTLWDNILKEMYLYPSFKEGIVEYKDGRLFRANMNYNRMLGTIQFIKGNDTLAVANETAIRVIAIGNDQFIFTPACLQLVYSGQKVHLYKNVLVRVADIRQVGIYGKTNTASSVETINQVYTSMNSFNLNVNETLLLNKASTFYIAGPDNYIVSTSKRNITKVLPGKEGVIKDYIKEKNINLANEKDLLQFANFLDKL